MFTPDRKQLVHPPSVGDLPDTEIDSLDWPWAKTVNSSESQQQMLSWPKISVVTIAYNRRSLIERAIRSILLQSYPNLEYIVIDGGSTDGTQDVILKYEPWITYWISEPDRGISHAINKGFSKATGDVLAWLNTDDYYLPGALQAVGEAFSKPDTDVVVGKGCFHNEQGELIASTPKHADFSCEALQDWEKNYFVQPSCFFSKRAWKECGPLDESLEYCMDVDLFLKMAERYKYSTVERLLSVFVIHPDSRSSGTITKYQAWVELNILLVKKFGNTEIPKQYLMRMATRLASLELELPEARRSFELSNLMLNGKLIDLVRYRWNKWRGEKAGRKSPDL